MRARTSQRNDRGATAVEFALVLPVALVMISFILAVGLRVFWSALADNATRAAARYGSVLFYDNCYPMAKTDSTLATGPQSIQKHTASAYGGMLGTPGLTVTNNGTVNTTSSNIAPCYGATYNTGTGFTPGYERCGREGDVITVTTTYTVPGLTGMQSLVNAVSFNSLNITGLATVRHTATARCE